MTSFMLPLPERERLQEMGMERMRSQGHLLRVALAFWLANGAPEVPQDFYPVGRTPTESGGAIS